ncbi:Aminoglycoside N(6')-acetyltransferase type 1 [Frondihabitans sp. 762G35]|uniref:GNAT family N-acetyltransferase n=1 Tax=Frondihabitans sp. 762G35 TaxID=1446794 RepID=UPI000D2030AC|nr:GNAT family N-acetyltransferase [Frondihabitans sp. 762G35]ARC57259.1 Aminoglycoside N(6')-acetyltransferase type 1 [Frondihabitans sp. 762G35]
MTATVESLGQATARDLDDLVALIRLLGYSIESDELASRLARLTREAGHETWVVRDADGRISAVAGGHVTWAYNSDQPTAQLLLLVVRPDVRRDGLGSLVLAHFERWGRSHRALQLSAVSAAATDSAHRFYQKRGYHDSGVLRYTKIA